MSPELLPIDTHVQARDILLFGLIKIVPLCIPIITIRFNFFKYSSSFFRILPFIWKLIDLFYLQTLLYFTIYKKFLTESYFL